MSNSREPFIDKINLELASLAFAFRMAAVVINRLHPLFPPYYFNDATIYDAGAWRLAQNWHGPIPQGNPTYLANEYLIAAIYTVFGHHPALGQLFNCALGAFGAVALAQIGTLLWRKPEGLIAGYLFALWPSCIFYNSQILKDNVVLACIFGALWALIIPSPLSSPPRGEGPNKLPRPGRERVGVRVLPLFLAVLILLIGSLFRWYAMLFIAAAFVISELAVRIRRGSLRLAQLAALLGFFVVLAGLKLGLHRSFFGHPVAPEYMKPGAGIAASPVDVTVRRLDPKALSDLRKNLQQNVSLLDRRQVQTLIKPDLEFHSWLEVGWFLPQGTLYVGFMPLPGFYPLGRNLGRWMAAFENLILLGLAALGIWGAYTLPKDSRHWMILLFVIAAAAVSGLLEPDLGAASRHKLQYLPLLFLFAAPALVKWGKGVNS